METLKRQKWSIWKWWNLILSFQTDCTPPTEIADCIHDCHWGGARELSCDTAAHWSSPNFQRPNVHSLPQHRTEAPVAFGSVTICCLFQLQHLVFHLNPCMICQNYKTVPNPLNSCSVTSIHCGYTSFDTP